MSHDFVCRIPLKPNNEPPKEDEVRKLLTNPKFRLVDEFAVRYLESIGAAPTPANIRKVKSEIPVKRFKLKAAYKSRGGLEDMMYLEKVEPKNHGRHLWRGCAARSLFSEMVDKKLAAIPLTAAQEVSTKEKPLGLLGGGAPKSERDTARTGGFTLNKLQTNGVHDPNRAAPMSPLRRDDIASRVALARLATQSTQEKSRTARSRQGRRAQVGAPDFVQEPEPESLGIRIAMDDILSIQNMFTRTFPLKHIGDRIAPQDLAVLVGELTSICMAQLILNVCHLCEWAIVHNCHPPEGHNLSTPDTDQQDSFTIQPLVPRKGPQGAAGAGDTGKGVGPVMWGGGGEEGSEGGGGKPLLAPSVQAVLVETFRLWIDVQGRISKRTHMVIAYPIYLMLIRVAVETVLRNAVPAMFKGPKEEVLVLDKTDRIISALLDPDGYLNYPLPAPPGTAFVKVLQPARPPPEGVPALNPRSRPWAPLSGSQGIKSNKLSRFYTVSSHVKTLLNSSTCSELNMFKNAQLPPVGKDAAGAGAKTPRGERKPGDGNAQGKAVTDDSELGEFNAVFTAALPGPVLEKIYLLALQKRESLRNLGGKKKAGEREVVEDEALNIILPVGVEYLKKPTLGGSHHA